MLYINFVLLTYNLNQHLKLPVCLHVHMSGSVTSKLHDILSAPRVCVSSYTRVTFPDYVLPPAGEEIAGHCPSSMPTCWFTVKTCYFLLVWASDAYKHNEDSILAISVCFDHGSTKLQDWVHTNTCSEKCGGISQAFRPGRWASWA